MALKTIDGSSVSGYSLEDIFTDADVSPEKLEWVNGWRRLPHIDPEMQKVHEYPEQFAADIFGRIESELRKRVDSAAESAGVRTGRLFFVPAGEREGELQTGSTPALPVRFIVSSDPEIVAAGEAESYDQGQLLSDRQEGHFVVSFETSGGWVALRKDMLTEVLGAGSNANVVGLPPAAAAVARLMCPGLVADEASVPPSVLNV